MVIIFVALLIVAQRGLIMGGALLIVLTTVLSKGLSFKGLIKKYLMFFLLMLVVISQSEAISYRLTGVFFERTTQLINVEDASTLFRLGHIQGYLSLLQDDPYAAIVGSGPMGEIYNPFAGRSIQLLEMSILNLAIWFGIP